MITFYCLCDTILCIIQEDVIEVLEHENTIKAIVKSLRDGYQQNKVRMNQVSYTVMSWVAICGYLNISHNFSPHGHLDV